MSLILPFVSSSDLSLFLLLFSLSRSLFFFFFVFSRWLELGNWSTSELFFHIWLPEREMNNAQKSQSPQEDSCHAMCSRKSNSFHCVAESANPQLELIQTKDAHSTTEQKRNSLVEKTFEMKTNESEKRTSLLIRSTGLRVGVASPDSSSTCIQGYSLIFCPVKQRTPLHTYL